MLHLRLAARRGIEEDYIHDFIVHFSNFEHGGFLSSMHVTAEVPGIIEWTLNLCPDGTGWCDALVTKLLPHINVRLSGR